MDDIEVVVGQIWQDDDGLWQVSRLDGSYAFVRAYPEGGEEMPACTHCIPHEAKLVCKPLFPAGYDEDGNPWWDVS